MKVAKHLSRKYNGNLTSSLFTFITIKQLPSYTVFFKTQTCLAFWNQLSIGQPHFPLRSENLPDFEPKCSTKNEVFFCWFLSSGVQWFSVIQTAECLLVWRQSCERPETPSCFSAVILGKTPLNRDNLNYSLNLCRSTVSLNLLFTQQFIFDINRRAYSHLQKSFW